MSIEKCWFCSGDINPEFEVELAVKTYDHLMDPVLRVVSFCSRNCRDTYRFGLDYKQKEEPDIVY